MADRLSKLEKAYQRNPELPLFARLADLYLRRNMPFRALEICEEGCEHFPNYTTGFLVLSKCYAARGDFEAARKAMGRALRLDPENPVGFKRLSSIYQELGNSDLAVKSLKQAGRLDPLDRQVDERMDQLTYSMRLESAVPTEEHFDTLPQETREKPSTFVLDEEEETEEISPGIPEDAPETTPASPDEYEEEPVPQEIALETEPELSAEGEELEVGFLEDQEEPSGEFVEEEEEAEGLGKFKKETEEGVGGLGEFEKETEELEEEGVEGLGEFGEETEEKTGEVGEFEKETEELEEEGIRGSGEFEEAIDPETTPTPEEPSAPEPEMEPGLSPAEEMDNVGLWDDEEPESATTPANGDPFAPGPETEPVDFAEDDEETVPNDIPDPPLSAGGIGDLGDVVDSISSANTSEADEEPAPRDSLPAEEDEGVAAVEPPEDSGEEPTLDELPSLEDLVFSMEEVASPAPADVEEDDSSAAGLSPGAEPADLEASSADDASPVAELADLGEEAFIDASTDLEPAPVAPVEEMGQPEPAPHLEEEDRPDESDQDDDLQKIAAAHQAAADAPLPDSSAAGPPPSRRPRETGSHAVSGLGPRDDDELIKLFQEIETQQTQELEDHAAMSSSSIPSVPEDEAVEDEDEADRQIATVTLAEIYTIQGLTQRAIDIYRQILDHDPDNEEIRGKLADLECGDQP